MAARSTTTAPARAASPAPRSASSKNIRPVSGTNFVPRMSLGAELSVLMPIINAPFRLYYAYNPLRLYRAALLQRREPGPEAVELLGRADHPRHVPAGRRGRLHLPGSDPVLRRADTSSASRARPSASPSRPRSKNPGTGNRTTASDCDKQLPFRLTCDVCSRQTGRHAIPRVSGESNRSDGRLKSIFWPTVENAWDVNYLGQQGFWICVIIAVLREPPEHFPAIQFFCRLTGSQRWSSFSAAWVSARQAGRRRPWSLPCSFPASSTRWPWAGFLGFCPSLPPASFCPMSARLSGLGVEAGGRRRGQANAL